MTQRKPIYNRILLKLSGEVLMGDGSFGIHAGVLDRIIGEIGALVQLGVQVGIVIGGGNMFRGSTATSLGIGRITADQLGMLATVMNAVVMRDVMIRQGIAVRVLSAIAVSGVAEAYDRLKAIRHLEKNRVVIFAGGTGNPLFTTDSAASLRAIEIGADALLKATNVDGIYTADPAKDKTATRYHRLTYDQALQQELGVMDLSAFTQCRDHNVRMRVFDIRKPKILLNILLGADEGTLVER